MLSPGDLLEQVVIQQRPMGVADLRMEKRAEGWQEIATKFDIQGTIMLPIRHKDRCLGILMLGSKRWGYLIGSEARSQIMIVVGELAAALFRLEADLQHKQAKRPDEVLLRLLEKLRTLATLEQRLEAEYRQLTSLLSRLEQMFTGSTHKNVIFGGESALNVSTWVKFQIKSKQKIV